MPILKIVSKSYSDDHAVKNIVNYVLSEGYGMTGGYAIDPQFQRAMEQLFLVRALWYKEGGRQIRHFILSFSKKESISYDQALLLAFKVCQYYVEYQCLYGIHTDTDHLHIHFAVSTVSYMTGRMYAGGLDDWYRLRQYVQDLLPYWYVKLVISDGTDYLLNNQF